MFSRQSGEFGRYPDAYLNLNRMRNRYPIYGDCKGAAEALDEFVARKKQSMPDAFAWGAGANESDYGGEAPRLCRYRIC